jgi:hypothetical protein
MQLQHLALGDAVGGVGQHAHDAHLVQLDHELERARVEEIADQHAGGVAPQEFAVRLPRRRSDSSTTSSCRSVAVWMNSTIAAACQCASPE